MKKSIHGLLLNGPNLNLLGLREPAIYGSASLDDIEKKLIQQALEQDVVLEAKQSNSESELISFIHQARTNKDFVIFNPAAFTHTSIALRDALLGTELPFYEVHLSNVFAREAFRQHSYFSDIAQGVLVGLGVFGYELALQAAIQKFGHRN